MIGDMRQLILYKSSYRSEVLGATRDNQPNTKKMWAANFVVNLATGYVYKDRFDNRAGTVIEGDELVLMRTTGNYTPPSRKHFEEDLFQL